jgi:hypothetical protein
VINIFKKTPAEKEAEVEIMVDKAEAKAEVKIIKQEVKEQRKINRKINKGKKGVSVTTMEIGDKILCVIESQSRRKGLTYNGHDDNQIFDI